MKELPIERGINPKAKNKNKSLSQDEVIFEKVAIAIIIIIKICNDKRLEVKAIEIVFIFFITL